MTTSSESNWDAVELDEHQAEEQGVTQRIRLAVYRRDKWRCRKCGEMELMKLTVHHVVFRSQGGGHDIDNLLTVCWHCHRLIHDKIVEVFRRGVEWFFSDKRHWRSRRPL